MDTPRVWPGSAPGSPKVSRGTGFFTQQVDVSDDATGADADYSENPLRGIYVGGSGSVFVKCLEDTAFFEWAVPAGTRTDGIIVAVQQAPSATKLVGYR